MKDKISTVVLSFLVLALVISLPLATAQFANSDSLTLATVNGDPEDDDNDNGVVITPRDAVEETGMSYGEWAGEWWNWALQFPSAINPVLDETGEFCGLGQDEDGPVWFLAGNFGGTTVRECTVPDDKILFFPLLNVVSPSPDFGPDVETVIADANSDVNSFSVLELDVDGEPVTDLFAYAGQSPPGGFLLRLPPGAIFDEFFGLSGDRDPTVADGYWAMLELD